MDVPGRGSTNGSVTLPVTKEELGLSDVRKGQWTEEEDELLMSYVQVHGEGRWNSAAHITGLKRTGKSCRLRWLNYLRPDVRRGNITLEEQLMILDLQSRWGNRWSKIASNMPGRTDNEIKNYWRTRVQKQAKKLNCNVNSQQFRDAVRYEWIPHMMEQIQAKSSRMTTGRQTTPSTPSVINYIDHMEDSIIVDQSLQYSSSPRPQSYDLTGMTGMSDTTSDSSNVGQFSPASDLSECYNPQSSQLSHTSEQVPSDDRVNWYPGQWTDVMPDIHPDHVLDDNNYLCLLSGRDQTLLSDDFLNEDNIGFLQWQLPDEDLLFC